MDLAQRTSAYHCVGSAPCDCGASKVEHLVVKPGMVVLDVGCEPGRLTVRVAKTDGIRPSPRHRSRSTYVINGGGVIASAYVDRIYTEYIEPTDIATVLWPY